MGRILDIGRPTQFGRPTFGDNDDDMHVQKTQTEDGLPMGFGRPTHRTSETRRTSDIQIVVLFNVQVFAATLLTRRHFPSSDVRPISDVRRDGRPKPVGRPNCLRADLLACGLVSEFDSP